MKGKLVLSKTLEEVTKIGSQKPFLYKPEKTRTKSFIKSYFFNPLFHDFVLEKQKEYIENQSLREEEGERGGISNTRFLRDFFITIFLRAKKYKNQKSILYFCSFLPGTSK